MEDQLNKVASKAAHATANTFLAQALVEKNIAMAFVESRHFKAYVAYISGGRFKAPTVYGLVACIDDLYERLHAKVKKTLSDRAFIAFEVDSLENFSQHLDKFGLKYSDGPTTSGTGTVFAFIDAPEGYEIELIQTAKGGASH